MLKLPIYQSCMQAACEWPGGGGGSLVVQGGPALIATLSLKQRLVWGEADFAHATVLHAQLLVSRGAGWDRVAASCLCIISSKKNTVCKSACWVKMAEDD